MKSYRNRVTSLSNSRSLPRSAQVRSNGHTDRDRPRKEVKKNASKPSYQRDKQDNKYSELTSKRTRKGEYDHGYNSPAKRRSISKSRTRSPLNRHRIYKRRSRPRSYSSRSHDSYSSRHRYRHKKQYHKRKDHNLRSPQSPSSSESLSTQNKTSKLISGIEIGGRGPEMVAGAAAKGNNEKTISNFKSEINSNTQPNSHTPQPISIEHEDVQRQINEEVQKQVEAEIQKRVTEYLHSASFKKELEQKLEQERQRQMITIRAEVESEKRRILEEFKRKEEEEKRTKQQLEEIMAANEKLVKQEQMRRAEEQAKADEERLLELQKMIEINEAKKKKALIEKEQDGSMGKTAFATGRQKIVFKMGVGSVL